PACRRCCGDAERIACGVEHRTGTSDRLVPRPVGQPGDAAEARIGDEADVVRRPQEPRCRRSRRGDRLPRLAVQRELPHTAPARTPPPPPGAPRGCPPGPRPRRAGSGRTAAATMPPGGEPAGPGRGDGVGRWLTGTTVGVSVPVAALNAVAPPLAVVSEPGE